MSEMKPTKEWSAGDIDLMVDLLAQMESPRVGDRYWELVHGTTAYADPYANLSEDIDSEGEPVAPRNIDFNQGYFERATLGQVRRYLSQMPRRERFCDGAILQHFENGTFRAALERLRSLRDAM